MVNDIVLILPLVTLVVWACGLLIVDLFVPDERKSLTAGLAALGLVDPTAYEWRTAEWTGRLQRYGYCGWVCCFPHCGIGNNRSVWDCPILRLLKADRY